MSREAMQMALEALEDSNDVARMEFGDEDYYSEAINALRQALETEQEPVAWASSLDFDDDDQEIIPAKDKGKLGTSNCDIPLYTAPPKREWVSLTDEEIDALSQARSLTDELMDCVEACTTWCGLCGRNPWHRNQP